LLDTIFCNFDYAHRAMHLSSHAWSAPWKFHTGCLSRPTWPCSNLYDASMESYMGLMRKIMSLLLLLLSRRFPWESGLMRKQ
jgi:hypothetical protein